MAPLFYVIALMGCSDDGGACQQVRALPVRYASADACAAATRDAVSGATDADYPTITAECRPGDPRNLVALRSDGPLRPAR